jgi:hypothetical protein
MTSNEHGKAISAEARQGLGILVVVPGLLLLSSVPA